MIFLESRHRATVDRSQQVRNRKGPVRWWHVLIITFIIVVITLVVLGLQGKLSFLRVFRSS